MQETIQRGLRFLVSELDYPDLTEGRWDVLGTAEILNLYKREISLGRPREAIGELGGLDRQLLQESDFYSTGRAILKKMTSEDEKDNTLDFSTLPLDLRNILEQLECAEINTSNLRQVIKVADQDKDTLKWITEHHEEFVDLDNLFIKDDNEITWAERKATGLRPRQPPRDSYKLSEVSRPNKFKEASERRLAHLKASLRDIQKLWTLKEMENHLTRIRGVYQEDSFLKKSWSPARREEDRKNYLQSLMSHGLDYESIRRKLWAAFDREEFKKSKIVDEAPLLMESCKEWYLGLRKNGKINSSLLTTEPRGLFREEVIIPPAIWDVERSVAFQELNQTSKQWTQIYGYFWKHLNEVILFEAKKALTEKEKLEVRKFSGKYHRYLDKETVKRLIHLLAETGEE